MEAVGQEQLLELYCYRGTKDSLAGSRCWKAIRTNGGVRSSECGGQVMWKLANHKLYKKSGRSQHHVTHWCVDYRCEALSMALWPSPSWLFGT